MKTRELSKSNSKQTRVIKNKQPTIAERVKTKL
jgi:hypothetical protein